MCRLVVPGAHTGLNFEGELVCCVSQATGETQFQHLRAGQSSFCSQVLPVPLGITPRRRWWLRVLCSGPSGLQYPASSAAARGRHFAMVHTHMLPWLPTTLPTAPHCIDRPNWVALWRCFTQRMSCGTCSNLPLKRTPVLTVLAVLTSSTIPPTLGSIDPALVVLQYEEQRW